MSEIRAKFSVEQYENYGTNGAPANLYLSEEQLEKVTTTVNRVESQLDWIAQILGWSGDYWENLPSVAAEKRNLLKGTFGFYEGYIYPEVVEIRNWESSVVVKEDDRLLGELTFYLGNHEYTATKLIKEGGTFTLFFDNLPSQFFDDISAGFQLKKLSSSSHNSPFTRVAPGVAANATFVSEVKDSSIILYPGYDTKKTLPYLFNYFIQGSRYYFDKPYTLQLREDLTLEPLYDFAGGKWYIDIPTSSAESEVGDSALLQYGVIASLKVSLSQWVDPTDWNVRDVIDNFKGVWNNKGGALPFNFLFDSLNLHGFDERKSIILSDVQREVSFDRLLESIYYQRASVSPNSPTRIDQVWWDSVNGTFSVYGGGAINCGPWVEIDYPSEEEDSYLVDLTFENVQEFLGYSLPVLEGAVVRIQDISGLSEVLDLQGVTQTLPGPGSVDFFKAEGGEYWKPLKFEFETEEDFSFNSEYLPPKVPITIVNSEGLSPDTIYYSVKNLKFVVGENLPTLLTKSEQSGDWYLSPPSSLKYIGNTRLFSSSLDYSSPSEGELNWDFSNPDWTTREAKIFYYNQWVQNPSTLEWQLEGDWFGVNTNQPTSPPPNVLNFGTVLVYCDGDLVEEEFKYQNSDFQFYYTINEGTGVFQFFYRPLSYRGSVELPRIEISDSLTSSFRFDISETIFSGLIYYQSPNVLDSSTLLRIWKSEALSVIDSSDQIEILRNVNPLRADVNKGSGDENWERFFLRLPPAYGRNDEFWQKVNKVCQNFGYWGSPITPEEMSCPPERTRPTLYEEAHLLSLNLHEQVYLYSEPYLYSAVVPSVGVSEDFENSYVLPGYDRPYDEFDEATLNPYDPLHNRRANTEAPVGRGYGDWQGSYFRSPPCSTTSGFLDYDLRTEVLETMPQPAWDASMYKLPQSCLEGRSSSTVDSNHFKIGYAFFSADLSAAEDGFFSFSKG